MTVHLNVIFVFRKPDNWPWKVWLHFWIHQSTIETCYTTVKKNISSKKTKNKLRPAQLISWWSTLMRKIEKKKEKSLLDSCLEVNNYERLKADAGCEQSRKWTTPQRRRWFLIKTERGWKHVRHTTHHPFLFPPLQRPPLRHCHWR